MQGRQLQGPLRRWLSLSSHQPIVGPLALHLGVLCATCRWHTELILDVRIHTAVRHLGVGIECGLVRTIHIINEVLAVPRGSCAHVLDDSRLGVNGTTVVSKITLHKMLCLAPLRILALL